MLKITRFIGIQNDDRKQRPLHVICYTTPHSAVHRYHMFRFARPLLLLLGQRPFRLSRIKTWNGNAPALSGRAFPPGGNGCARLGAFDFPQEHKSSCVAGFLFKKILSFWTNFLFLYCLKSPSPSPVSPRLWILSYSTANLGVFTATTGDKEDSKTLWQVWYSYFCWKEECRYSVDRQLGV